MPDEATWAVWMLGVCERFGVLPSALLSEDSELMRMLEIEKEVRGSGE